MVLSPDEILLENFKNEPPNWLRPILMQIEVVYALANKQTLLSLKVAEKTTIKTAIIQSGILEKYPQINLKDNKVGIFSKITALDTILREKDRIEIYRPLIADPKEARRKRAKEGKQTRHKKT